MTQEIFKEPEMGAMVTLLSCLGVWDVDGYTVHVFTGKKGEGPLAEASCIVSRGVTDDNGEVCENAIIITEDVHEQLKATGDPSIMEDFVRDFFLASLLKLGDIKSN